MSGSAPRASSCLPLIIVARIDLDIEMPGLPYLATFVNHVLEYAQQQKDTKRYYVTGAPQCPCPDQNMQE